MPAGLIIGRLARKSPSLGPPLSHLAGDAMTRDYQAAIAALNSLQSNAAAIKAVRKSAKALNALAIPEMIDWCRKAGHEPSDFDKLNPIHVAGTKGKGSTSSFISSILGQYLPSAQGSHPLLHNIGLFTSPHLRFVRERIQLNNKPIDEHAFAKYFFEVWDRYEAVEPTKEGERPSRPMYFRYLTVMALHAYLENGVDTAIMECGIGGEYDSTNMLVNPSVTAITSLGIDHTPILGPTIEEIAWHKAGIMKPSATAFTAPQPSGAMKVLYERAAERGVKLHLVQQHPEVELLKLGLEGDFQKINASVAVAVAAAQLRKLGHKNIPDPTIKPDFKLPEEFKRGLEQVKLGGRCEVRKEGHISWHIDGGHTKDSIEGVGKWFGARQRAGKAQKRILIFNQQTTDRNAGSLVKTLHATIQDAQNVSSSTGHSKTSPFTHAFFCTNTTFKAGVKPELFSLVNSGKSVDKLVVQKALAQSWTEIDSSAEVNVVRTIEEAIEGTRSVASNGEETTVLITGSLHLAGGALDVLETPNEKEYNHH